MLKKFFAALVAIMFALSLTACSNPTPGERELIGAGFSDPASIGFKEKEGDSTKNVMFATAGSCRIRFIFSELEGRFYATVPGSPSTNVAEFVGDPSLELLKRDPRFSHCFSSAKKDRQE